ncbi:hypothetical protein D9615_007588 [Tricholomella constricta]|uniref:Uncharacterized protein n=1 Tax=Tricholomella constricta TaxID=117010 RepID=A0A8H5H852_9AGAR|nr:hypothetical protein D9615_007588 [Tricholomella constricta]
MLLRPRSTWLSSFVSVLSVLLPAFRLARAQSGFTWQFTQDAGSSLPECATMSINVTNPGASSVDAYYMIALAVNGTPTTSLVGTSVTNLAWLVNQPVGTSILFYLVDSKGNSGKVSPRLYTVTTGQSSECLPSQSTAGFTIAANATEEIATCDLWELIMRGGTPPFNLLLVAPGALAPTNVTLPNGQDLYRYVNRAAPNGALLAAVSDSKGVWAKGTSYVKTIGSSDTSCPTRSSSGGVAPPATITTNDPQTSPGTSVRDPHHVNKNPIIIGICVGVGCLILLGIAAFFFLRRRRRQDAKQGYLEPRQFQATAANNVPTAPSEPCRPSKFVNQENSDSAVALPRNTSTSRVPVSVTSVPSSYEPPTTPSAPSFTASSVPQTSPGGRSSKMREAAAVTAVAQLASEAVTTPPTAPSSIQSTEDSRWPRGVDPISPEPGEAVYQHTDARAVTMRELPPPYGAQTSGPAATGQGS